MKIAYTCQAYPPLVSGAAIVLQRLAEGITAQDHMVLVLTSSDRGDAYSERQNGLEVSHLRSYQNPVREHHHFVLWSYKDVLGKLKQFKPNVVHIHDPLNFGVAVIRAAKQLNIPTIVTIHQLPWFISKYVSDRKLAKQLVEKSLWRYSNWFLSQCDASVTPSKMIADIVSAHTDYRPRVISNGVDLELFTPDPEHPREAEELCTKYHLCSDSPVILHVGRLDVDKNVDLVVRAAAKVLQTIDAQLVIVGDGNQREHIIQLCESLGIREKCCFPGFVPKSDDLPGIYRLATLFVTASEIEIQSSVVLEGAASGLPVVTVEASSMPEFVINGENGYLVPPGDIDALAERMISLVSDQPKAKRMGKAGREIAEKHSNERFLRDHLELYDSLAVPAYGAGSSSRSMEGRV